MEYEQIISRLAEIKDEMNKPDADLDKLTEETDTLLARRKELEDAAAEKELKRKNLMDQLNAGFKIPEVKTPVEDSDMIERKQFMDYIVTGKLPEDSVLKRADATNVAADMGVMIPHHVQQEIIKEIEKIHGRLYGKVKHTNLPGGVEYPIGSFGATFSRISESTISDRQKGGSITGSVIFKYNIGEIRLAKTLLQKVLSVPAFESELAKVIAEAYVKAMDDELLNGVPANSQMEGILTKTTVKTISLNENDMKDWKALQSKIFGKLPLGFRSKNYEFVMTAGTYECNIKTLADDNNRPVYSETFSPVDGTLNCRFKGREVTLVENDLLPDFDDAAAGKVFGMLWVPAEAYAINSNMGFTVTKYFDHEKNQEVTKALVINDGKVLRPDLIYLLKKVAVSSTPSTPSRGG